MSCLLKGDRLAGSGLRRSNESEDVLPGGGVFLLRGRCCWRMMQDDDGALPG